MTVLLNRRATLIVDGLAVEGLRTVFKIEKTLEKHPNTAEIAVYNLAEKSRRSMQRKGAPVLLQVGYETATQAIIFTGDARLIEHKVEGPDWITKIESGDAERAIAGAHMSESFAEGTRVLDIVGAAVREMGIDPGNIYARASELQRTMASGYTAHGRASQVLASVLAGEGFTFSIQNGRLQILKPAESSTETVFVLNSRSGLVGSPEHGTPPKKGKPATLKITSLLLPTLAPGRRVQVDALATKGLYKIEKLTHRGDTHGGEWLTEMEATPV